MQSYSATPRAPADAPAWAIRVVQDIVTWIENKLRGPQALTVYSTSKLPDATKNRGAIIALSNGAGSKWLAISDGAVWRYPDGGAV